MAIIKHYYRNPGDERYTCEIIEHDTFAWKWICFCFESGAGNNFKIYEGGTSDDCEISRDMSRMRKAKDVSIIEVPAGVVTTAIIASVIVSTAVVLLTPKPKALDNVNRQQESPNNSLSRRANEARPNQRIVDICGKVKSIPDVIQPEWARYVDKIEVRTAAYCVGRKQIQIEELRDGGTTFEDSEQSAGIYYPFKSPNNSAPDIQIGDPIDEPVLGVFESGDALDQTLRAPNEVSIDLTSRYSVRRRTLDGDPVGDLNDFDESFFGPFGEGDRVNLVDVYVDNGVPGSPIYEPVGTNTHDIIGNFGNVLRFDRTGDPTWDNVAFANQPIVDDAFNPKLEAEDTNITVGPFTISSLKVDRLVVNIYAPNGIFKEGTKGKQSETINFTVFYQKLNDNLDPVGPLTPVSGTLSGATSDAIGATVDIDLGGLTFVQWSAERTSDKDFEFNGTVVDEIKVRSVFGLYSVDRTDFGDITMIQTQRKAIQKTLLVSEPEVNCIATEMVNKYLGGGSFDPTLTPNTQGMQTLIRVALDNRIGRRTIEEIDADLFIDLQEENEEYFQSSESGQFSYSFDSADTTAQETFFTILNAIFCIGWREGRVLKATFEKPQTVPSRVFTHRSKQPNSETWDRNFDRDNDSIEFKYIDDQFYNQEILTIPTDGSGTNPLTVEIPGIKGLSQATWRAYREYNKLLYSEISVDFSSTEEGRFVKPNQLISVVKGTRIASEDGYVLGINGLTVELSDRVTFTAGDDHFILFKRRDGTVESIPAFESTSSRFVELGFFPSEPLYTGNDEEKTEFSFGNEARLKGQWILPQTIDPSSKQYVAISGIGYSDLFYKDDPIQPVLGGFSDGFSDGFDN